MRNTSLSRGERGRWNGSGNAKGRPKKGETMRDALRQVVTKRTKKEIAEKLVQLALAGDVRAMALLYDNHDGKLPTQIGGVTDDYGSAQPIPLRLLPPLDG